MKCDKLKAIDDLYERKIRNGSDPYKIHLVHVLHQPVYLKNDVDAAIAELKAENERLNNALDKERSETIKYMDELCNAKNEIERFTIDKRNAELRADVADATVEKLKAENAELKQRLESLKATHYTEMVDAGMRERRLKRALYKACANWANLQSQQMAAWGQGRRERRWRGMETACLKKSEEYK